MGNELRDLVKGYLAQLELDLPDMSRIQGKHSETSVDESDWLKALRWCPRELLDLVNSKACRGKRVEISIRLNTTLVLVSVLIPRN